MYSSELVNRDQMLTDRDKELIESRKEVERCKKGDITKHTSHHRRFCLISRACTSLTVPVNEITLKFIHGCRGQFLKTDAL